MIIKKKKIRNIEKYIPLCVKSFYLDIITYNSIGLYKCIDKYSKFVVYIIL